MNMGDLVVCDKKAKKHSRYVCNGGITRLLFEKHCPNRIGIVLGL